MLGRFWATRDGDVREPAASIFASPKAMEDNEERNQGAEQDEDALLVEFNGPHGRRLGGRVASPTVTHFERWTPQ